jgi:DNA-binding protein H-NS
MGRLSIRSEEGNILSTVHTLRQQIADLQKELDNALRAERSEALGKIRELMVAYSITPDELGAKRRVSSTIRPAVPKYRDPASGTTWSGRGKHPRWFDKSNPEHFAIEQEQ